MLVDRSCTTQMLFTSVVIKSDKPVVRQYLFFKIRKPQIITGQLVENSVMKSEYITCHSPVTPFRVGQLVEVLPQSLVECRHSGTQKTVRL